MNTKHLLKQLRLLFARSHPLRESNHFVDANKKVARPFLREDDESQPYKHKEVHHG